MTVWTNASFPGAQVSGFAAALAALRVTVGKLLQRKCECHHGENP